MIITHSSSVDFDNFDENFYSKFGDSGQGIYFYKSKYCAYGIAEGQYIYTCDIKPNSVTEDYRKYWAYNSDIDVVVDGNVVIVKKQAIEKIVIIEKTIITETLYDKWGAPLMFACANGEIYIV